MAELVYYEKFSPDASKIPYAPGQDNFLQQLNDGLFAGRGCSTAAKENQVPRALFHQPAPYGEPQASVATCD